VPLGDVKPFEDDERVFIAKSKDGRDYLALWQGPGIVPMHPDASRARDDCNMGRHLSTSGAPGGAQPAEHLQGAWQIRQFATAAAAAAGVNPFMEWCCCLQLIMRHVLIYAEFAQSLALGRSDQSAVVLLQQQ
jgi:hypothetical protein